MIRSLSDEIAVKLATDMLISGRIVIMPCDTIYGILGLSPETEEKINGIKGRLPEKPYIRLLDDVKTLHRVSSKKIPEGLLELLPAPLTLILRDTSGQDIGYRVPDDKRLLEILSYIKKPLFSTSVNKSGSPPLWKISDIRETFGEEVDLILDGGDLPGGMPSTVLDITNKPYRVLRQGGFIVPARFLSL